MPCTTSTQWNIPGLDGLRGFRVSKSPTSWGRSVPLCSVSHGFRPLETCGGAFGCMLLWKSYSVHAVHHKDVTAVKQWFDAWFPVGQGENERRDACLLTPIQTFHYTTAQHLSCLCAVCLSSSRPNVDYQYSGGQHALQAYFRAAALQMDSYRHICGHIRGVMYVPFLCINLYRTCC